MGFSPPNLCAAHCRMSLLTIISNFLSGRLGFRKIRYFGLNALEHGISNERARTKDLNANQLALGIESCRNILANLNTTHSPPFCSTPLTISDFSDIPFLHQIL